MCAKYSMCANKSMYNWSNTIGMALFSSKYALYRGSYSNAHVLLKLLKELRKRDKIRGLLSILSLFRYEFN